MEFINIIRALWGAWIGYGVFYLRYENRQIIDELRSHLKETKKDLQHAIHELEEHLQQNLILKEKTTELLAKNEDLSQIVWELSRYYYHIKVWAEKASELAKLLQLPDSNIESALKHLPGSKIHESKIFKPSDEQEVKKFF